MLSVKLGDNLGQNRHCPGVNGSMVVSGESFGSSKDVRVELGSEFDGGLIGKFVIDAVVVVVSVVSTI